MKYRVIFETGTSFSYDFEADSDAEARAKVDRIETAADIPKVFAQLHDFELEIDDFLEVQEDGFRGVPE